MKIKISMEEKEFQENIKHLREQLAECQKTGVLPENLKEELEVLSAQEQKLLTELLPYYRVYATDLKQTTLTIDPLKAVGAFTFNGYMEHFLSLGEGLFLGSSVEGQLQFFSVQTGEETGLEVEWSAPLPQIKERLAFLTSINEKEILLLTVLGEGYLLTIHSPEMLPDVMQTGEISVTPVEIEGNSSAFGRCLALDDSFLLVEHEEDTLSLLELVKGKKGYCLKLHENTKCMIPQWSTFALLNPDTIVIGTMTGELHFIRYQGGTLSEVGQTPCLTQPIRKISLLEQGDKTKNAFLVLGNHGQFQILSYEKDKINLMLEKKDLPGNLFDAQSQEGTAIVLSEDGALFLLEENFGDWQLSENETVENIFFTTLLPLKQANYLLLDLEGTLHLLRVHRMDTPEDLWELPLYS